MTGPNAEIARHLMGREILGHIDRFAECSEARDHLTRTYLTDRHRRANALVSGWMEAAGMTARVDAVGNVVGRYEGARAGSPALVPGSHLDTVRDAGKYDGIPGVIAATAFRRRGVKARIDKHTEIPSCHCTPWIMEQLGRAVDQEGVRLRELASGAGHDAMAMAAIADIGMLLVRCKDGVSHNAAESIGQEDAEMGARVLLRFIQNFKPRRNFEPKRNTEPRTRS